MLEGTLYHPVSVPLSLCPGGVPGILMNRESPLVWCLLLLPWASPLVWYPLHPGQQSTTFSMVPNVIPTVPLRAPPLVWYLLLLHWACPLAWYLHYLCMVPSMVPAAPPQGITLGMVLMPCFSTGHYHGLDTHNSFHPQPPAPPAHFGHHLGCVCHSSPSSCHCPLPMPLPPLPIIPFSSDNALGGGIGRRWGGVNPLSGALPAPCQALPA